MSVQAEGTGRRRSLAVALMLPVLAFVAGIALMGWALSQWSWAAHAVGLAKAPPPAAAPVPAPAPEPQQVASASRPGGPAPQSIVIDPEVTRRVGQLEQRLGDIYVQSRAAVGNADRAEGLLVAFAARRALDRGVGLGYIEGLLRERFGDSHRPAVATVITASRQPVTLEELQAGLKEIGPELTGAGPQPSWWDALRAELSGVIIVRKEGTPSTMPAERLERAQSRLAAGQVDVALAEVMRLPGRDNAAAWVQQARRYVAARRALDTIETAALLDPRNPPQPPSLAPAPVRRPAAAPRG